MSTTRNTSDHDSAAREDRPDWLDMQPADFGTELPMVQGALFSEPDRMGTPALFGGTFGEEL